MNPEKTKQDWLATLDAFFAEVERWAVEMGWETGREQREVSESRLGTYAAPVLHLERDGGRAVFEPIARCMAGESEGLVELLFWPNLTRFTLDRVGDGWKLRTSDGVAWPEGWGKQTFAYLTKELGVAA